MTNFSLILKELTESRGISQKWLADEANTTEATISRYINGIHQPNIKLVISVAKALGVSVDYLLGLTSMESSNDDSNDELRMLVKMYSRASDRDKKLLWQILEDYMSPQERDQLNQLGAE